MNIHNQQNRIIHFVLPIASMQRQANPFCVNRIQLLAFAYFCAHEKANSLRQRYSFPLKYR
jgi:hypothetical protein